MLQEAAEIIPRRGHILDDAWTLLAFDDQRTPVADRQQAPKDCRKINLPLSDGDLRTELAGFPRSDSIFAVNAPDEGGQPIQRLQRIVDIVQQEVGRVEIDTQVRAV